MFSLFAFFSFWCGDLPWFGVGVSAQWWGVLRLTWGAAQWWGMRAAQWWGVRAAQWWSVLRPTVVNLLDSNFH